MNLFDLYATITLDTSGYDQGVQEVAQSGSSLGTKLKSGLGTAAKAVGTGIAAVGAAATAAVGGLLALESSTEEYRVAMGRLNTAFETAGYGAETAKESYSAFYGILGDTDRATEASQLLAQLADNAEDVSVWTDIAAGVNGTFGDSLPIEGLIEAANETAKVGTVTGTLADALNWVGISEDEFNTKLAECSSESERNRLIMETLATQYDEASEAFYRNNDALVKSRENQTKVNDALAKVGDAVAKVKNALLEQFAPAIEKVSEKFADFISNIDVDALAEGIGNFVNAIIDNGPTIISIVAGIGAGFAAWKITGIVQSAVSAITSLIPALTGATTATTGLNTALSMNPIGIVITLVASLVTGLITLWNTNEDFRNAVKEIWDSIKGFFVDAWNAIKGVWEECVSFFRGIWDGITGIFSGVKDALSGWFSDAWQSVKDVFADWGEFFSGLWDKITNIFSGVWDWFTDIGSDIVNGIRNGISNAWDSLVGWFTNLWDSLFGNRTVAVSVTKSERTVTSSPSAGLKNINGSHALGLNYVPFDGYIAELHKGEMVLTSAQADIFRNPDTGLKTATRSGTFDRFERAISRLNAAQSDINITVQSVLDGKVIGETAYKYSRNKQRAYGV